MDSAFEPLIYAIDFGTTNSLLAAANREATHPPIPLDAAAPDPTILRSLLYFPDAGHCFYGSEAIAQYTECGMEGRLLRSVKKHLPSRAFIGTHIADRPMNLEDLIGVFLREMRVRADRFFGTEVKRVVLGRPARFSDDDADDGFAQYRLERAARIAGFHEVSFCPEPVAAAREFRTTLEQARLVLVADFGGGTSDFTVMRMRREGYDISDVLAIGGVAVAGDAYDASVMRGHVAPHFGSEVHYRVPLGRNEMRMPPALMEKICSPADATLLRDRDAMRFIRDVRQWSRDEHDRRCIDQLLLLVEDRLAFAVFEAIEAAKRQLSEADRAEIRYRYPGIDVQQPITRAGFAESSQRETGAIVRVLDDTLKRAGVAPGEVDIVCCTGGTARVPSLAAALADRFGPEKLTRFRAFHSVIRGLGEHALRLCQQPG